MIRACWERLRDPTADTYSLFIVTYVVTLLSEVSRRTTKCDGLAVAEKSEAESSGAEARLAACGLRGAEVLTS
jgi:hypothetical protein